MNSARSAGVGFVVLRNCWQMPGEFGGAPALVCSTPDSRKKRTLSGSLRSRPSGSVCSSDPVLTQYSFAEFTSMAVAQVPVAEQRTLRPPFLPVNGSVDRGYANGKFASGYR